ncbi:MAG: CoB--CoM heterodisulfide reductase iron-sulfur subunit A family protein [Candidatus Stahlbacteria bacterium]|jgi:heterodisulfide reductase subunit A|nr:MAG: CoB--CoM heterodisulfide reductase iron-sulfur subunit A family protein [Candidatus Stahlbacteria bacterium]
MPQDDLRIGVFVCECGTNIAGSVDVDKLVEEAKEMGNVVYTAKNRYVCSEPGQAEIKKAIEEEKLDRVVIAACSPRMHEPTFRQCVSEVGLNPYLVDMANIREQCSWVHMGDRVAATKKAKDIIKAYVARARYLEAQDETEITVTRANLVIGGGIAGMQAALDLADAGYQVYLVEKEPALGGLMAQLAKTYPTMDCAI